MDIPDAARIAGGTAMTEPIISARNLTKTFTRRKQRPGVLGALRGLADRSSRQVFAVSNVSFDIAPGEIVGYIGPNGAGKSTTIKMLTGILVPSDGSASVAGYVPWEQRRKLAQQIGVVFGQRTQLWWDLPLEDSLALLQYMYKVPTDRFRRNLGAAVELLDMSDFLATPVRQLSLGQRMRGDLAASILHEPPVLYLDEPTIGLDLVAKSRIRDYLADLNREAGVTVLLTTHDLADIERLCSRIIVIDHGELAYDGNLGTLKDRFGSNRRLIVDYDDTARVDPALLPGGVDLIASDGPRVTISFDRTIWTAPTLLDRMGAFGPIRDMGVEEPEIEDVIRQLYAAGTARDSAA
jgi:ABC-2 type transport system ATP-binding protein